jgi:uncharacterized membrane protein YedE/YeeE
MDLYTTTIALVQAYDHGSVLLVFTIGIIFGVIIQWARVDTFEKIAGFSMLVDLKIMKMLLLSVGLTMIGLYFMVENGLASYAPKTMIFSSVAIGATIFGIGMAIFGKCPGTGTISLAEGRLDVLVGIAGGLTGGVVYTYFFTDLQPLIFGDYGKITLVGLYETYALEIVLVLGATFILASFLIPKRELHYDKE